MIDLIAPCKVTLRDEKLQIKSGFAVEIVRWDQMVPLFNLSRGTDVACSSILIHKSVNGNEFPQNSPAPGGPIKIMRRVLGSAATLDSTLASTLASKRSTFSCNSLRRFLMSLKGLGPGVVSLAGAIVGYV